MNLRLLLVILALCLTAGCVRSSSGGSNVKGMPMTDFDALVSNAKRDLAPRTLPSGKLYCGELARTEVAQDRCIGDLEDLALNSETDKSVALANLQRALERIRFALNPCGFFDFECKRRKKEAYREQAPAR